MVDKTNSQKSKKRKIILPVAVVRINVTYNNTIISLTDTAGNVLAWSSSGARGFKGARKSTPYASQMVAETICSRAEDFKVKKIIINIKGPGAGREAVLRAFAHQSFEVLSIRDISSLPHNGCRLPKRRRV